MPKRIQRKRTKGWRMPKGAVYVGRGSPWGNPFVVGKHGRKKRCVELYEKLLSGWVCYTTDEECFEKQHRTYKYVAKHRVDLRGKDLVCRCRLDQPCHADILLRVANAKRGSGRCESRSCPTRR